MKDFYHTFKSYVEEEKIQRKQAVFFKGRATTYGELLEEADRVALALSSRGVKKGDIVALWIGNCTQFLPIFLGIVKCGAIAEPINILLTEYEVQPQLERTKPNVLFIAPDQLPLIERIRPNLPELKDVVLISGQAGKNTWSYDEFLTSASGTTPAVDIAVDDDILILFTSGTTGQPKGVLLSHKNLLSVVEGQRHRFAPLGEMVTLCSVPLSHIFGLNTLTFAALMRKWCVVIQERFEIHETARLIESYRIASISGVPTMVQSLVDVSKDYDMRSVSLILCGAAPVPEELYHKVERTFHCQMLQGWGLTEGSGNATSTPPGVLKIGSCGIPFEGIGVECAVFDAQDNPLPPGQIGELVMRGSLNMKGYLNNPQATAEVLRNGWLHTGDLARTDEDGYFYIVDRKKDMIIRGGYNIYPAEVESVLYTHPAVGEAAVFGVTDARKGETVAAKIMLKPGEHISEEEILAYCQQRLARYKVPKYVQITQEPLPKSATGKILRRMLKQDFEKSLE